MKRFNKQWIGKSPTKWLCKQAAKMQQELIPYIHSSKHQSSGCWHEVDPALNPSPTTRSVYQKCSLTIFHNCYKTILQHLLSPMKISLSGRVLSLASLFPSSLNASTDGPSCPLCQIMSWSNYHCC